MKVINSTQYDTALLTELLERCFKMGFEDPAVPDWQRSRVDYGAKLQWKKAVIRIEDNTRTKRHLVKHIREWHAQDNIRFAIALPKNADPKALVEAFDLPLRRFLGIPSSHKEPILNRDKRPWMDGIMGGSTIPFGKHDSQMEAITLAKKDVEYHAQYTDRLKEQVAKAERLLRNKTAELERETERLTTAQVLLKGLLDERLARSPTPVKRVRHRLGLKQEAA